MSWNIHRTTSIIISICRPLREVVSWNEMTAGRSVTAEVDLFVRSWVEITCWLYNGTLLTVDLFVRSWVEISMNDCIRLRKMSTSSWGRELKCLFKPMVARSCRSTSSWGRELKFPWMTASGLGRYVDLFVRSWVEMIYFRSTARHLTVDLFVRSWVEMIFMLCRHGISTSTSSWGRELKYIKCHLGNRSGKRRRLREVLSWKLTLFAIN